MTPDGDLLQAVAAGRADVVTDTIDRFVGPGIRLSSGRTLEADIVVSATGLSLLPIGGMTLTVDGAPVTLGERFAYRGMMLSGVPNLAFCVGYTNASWTLRADLVSQYVCRLLNHMARHDIAYGAPVAPPAEVGAAAAGPHLRLRPAGDRPVPQAGPPRPVDGPPELRARPGRHAPGRRPPRHDLRGASPPGAAVAAAVCAPGARLATVAAAGGGGPVHRKRMPVR